MGTITIITNTLRRPLALVEKSVRASLDQGEATVILIDQNSEPLVFPPEVALHPKFQHQHVVVPSVSMARNRAQYASSTEWILFCDDDGYLKDDYLQLLLSRIAENPEIDIFAGGIRRTDTGEFYSKRHVLGGDMRKFWNAKLLMGSNFVVRRAVFEELQKFDERFGAGAPFGSSEETDFAWKAFFSGKRMLYAPELVVFHVPPFSGSLPAEIQKARRYGFGKGAMVRKWLFKKDVAGNTWPLLELVEMLVVPLIRIVFSFLLLRLNDARIQVSALIGRWKGFFQTEATSND
jgi:GT2 family glycosyltransferase